MLKDGFIGVEGLFLIHAAFTSLVFLRLALREGVIHQLETFIVLVQGEVCRCLNLVRCTATALFLIYIP